MCFDGNRPHKIQNPQDSMAVPRTEAESQQVFDDGRNFIRLWIRLAKDLIEAGVENAFYVFGDLESEFD